MGGQGREAILSTLDVGQHNVGALGSGQQRQSLVGEQRGFFRRSRCFSATHNA
jgi:hypothetical protein